MQLIINFDGISSNIYLFVHFEKRISCLQLQVQESTLLFILEIPTILFLTLKYLVPILMSLLSVQDSFPFKFPTVLDNRVKRQRHSVHQKQKTCHLSLKAFRSGRAEAAMDRVASTKYLEWAGKIFIYFIPFNLLFRKKDFVQRKNGLWQEKLFLYPVRPVLMGLQLNWCADISRMRHSHCFYIIPVETSQ